MDKKYFVIDNIILSRTNMIVSRTKNVLSGQMDRALNSYFPTVNKGSFKYYIIKGFGEGRPNDYVIT